VVLALSHPFYALPGAIHQDLGAWAALNTLAHELFHIGYNDTFAPPGEEGEREVATEALYALQDEGMATYVSYDLTSFYPIPLEWHHHQMRSEIWVRSLIGRLNPLLAQAASPSPRERAAAERALVELGYSRGAFYAVGGFVARAIDRELGREALVDTVRRGPLAFIETYNRVVQPDLQIHWPATVRE
jgi:hypothetical protein